MTPKPQPVLGAAELNRATLARQLLLDRSPMPAVDAVSHLVGLQAQIPQNPYVGLWSRLANFSPTEVADAIVASELVRIVVMRGTVHLVTAADCLRLRPLTQPVLDSEIARHSQFAPLLVGVDLEAVFDFVRPLLQAQPRTGSELRSALAGRFPDSDAAALAYAAGACCRLCRCLPGGCGTPPARCASLPLSRGSAGHSTRTLRLKTWCSGTCQPSGRPPSHRRTTAWSRKPRISSRSMSATPTAAKC